MTTHNSLVGFVGLFFVVDSELLLHICSLNDGESGGSFINYPESHDDIWQREYYCKYRVDFDYYPRGRIVFNHTAGLYLLYHDPCVTVEAKSLLRRYPMGKCDVALDEHYQCNKCNPDYIV